MLADRTANARSHRDIDTVQSVTEGAYKWGFETDIEMEFAPKGLNEDIVRFISAEEERAANGCWTGA